MQIKRISGLLLMAVILFSFQACKKKKKEADIIVKTPETDSTTMVETIDPMTIQNEEFYGISTGDALVDIAGQVEKGTLENGEGDFEVYYINDDAGNEMGYVIPSPQDESSAGDIVITSPNAKTAEGIHVGMTFEELEAKLGPLEVHGSELESRTTATKDNITYVLDAYFNTYEVDKSEIKPETKIKAIQINRIYK